MSLNSRSNPQRKYMIALGTPPAATVSEQIDLAKFAESMGFEGIALVERLYDGHLMLTAIGQTTTKISLASSSGIHYRSPTLTAIDAGIIDQISNGRLLLGLVPGSPIATAPFGVKFEKEHILTMMREYVTIVRSLLAGERVKFSGSIYKIEGAELWFKPGRRIPIMLGCRGPKMSQLAGEVSDGIFGGALQPASFVRHTIDNVLLGARKAGRDPSELDLTGSVFYFDSLNDAKRFTAWWMNEQPMFDDVWTYCNLMGTVEKVRRCFRDGDSERAMDLVDEKIVETFAIWGTAENCTNLLEEFWSMGVSRIKIDPKGKVSAGVKSASNESVKRTIKALASVVQRPASKS